MPIVNSLAAWGETPGGRRSSELQHLITACAVHISSGAASGWAFGETERRDLQLCLLGPAPKHDCILSISRLDVTKKIEPAMPEPVEVLSAFAPQLAVEDSEPVRL